MCDSEHIKNELTDVLLICVMCMTRVKSVQIKITQDLTGCFIICKDN